MSSLLALMLIFLSSLIIITSAEPPHSSIPRSNNRYTQYSTDTDGNIIHPSSASDISSLSSPLNKESYHPPWNPSHKINSNGFLNDYYSRCPGEWEILANIRGKHGPRNHNRYMKLLNIPVACRQVPGDGNCLFHSIASCLYYAEYNNHLPMNSFDCINKLRSKSLALRNAAVDILQNVQNNGQFGDQIIQSLATRCACALFLLQQGVLESMGPLLQGTAQQPLISPILWPETRILKSGT